MLRDNPRGLLLYRDELAGWLASFDAYKRGTGADESQWLSIHRAGDLLVDRKSDPSPISVPRAAVCVTGGIQPMVIARVLKPKHFDSGLAARLLFAYPPKPIRKWTDREISDETQHAFESIMDSLDRLEPLVEDGIHDAPCDTPLSATGREEWIQFCNQHGQISGSSSAAWSKLEGYAARIALVVHCVRVVTKDDSLESSEAVDSESIKAGVTIVRWFGREVSRVYSIVSVDDSAEEAGLIQELLAIIRGCDGRITVRELTRRSRRFGESSEEAEKWLRQLVKLGLATSEVVKTKGRPRTDYVLHGGGVYERSKI